jgi:Xaa-Pro aminopeptidase
MGPLIFWLDVHDAGDKTVRLKPGMILTCEPGIYLPEENTGIRLETDVLVTKDGPVDLMEGMPIKEDEIEELMSSGAER